MQESIRGCEGANPRPRSRRVGKSRVQAMAGGILNRPMSPSSSPPDQSMPVASPSVPHARMGRYQLVAPLGVGGAATVYLGRATGVGNFVRDVAVKVLHPHLRL